MSVKSSGSNIQSLSAKQCRIASALNEWQKLIQKHFSANVEAQKVRFFFVVAASPEPIDLGKVGEAIDLSIAAASRNFYSLSDGRADDPGLDLVKSIVDYNDRRRRPVTLTPKGIAVATELINFFINKGELLTSE